jgi:hypothetical protein
MATLRRQVSSAVRARLTAALIGEVKTRLTADVMAGVTRGLTATVRPAVTAAVTGAVTMGLTAELTAEVPGRVPGQASKRRGTSGDSPALWAQVLSAKRVARGLAQVDLQEIRAQVSSVPAPVGPEGRDACQREGRADSDASAPVAP